MPAVTKMPPRWQVIFWSFAFAVGFAFAVHLLRADTASLSEDDLRDAVTEFMTFEKLDVVSDILSALAAQQSGDLSFADDEGCVKFFIFGSCGLSLCFFVLEWYMHVSADEEVRRSLWKLLPVLQLVHLCAEDCFQALLYIFVAASQMASSSGKHIAVLCGVAQAAVFAALRAQEITRCCQDRRARGVVVSASERAALVAGPRL